VTDDRTIYNGLSKLPAASILKWSNGDLHVRNCWLLPNPDNKKLDCEDAVEMHQ